MECMVTGHFFLFLFVLIYKFRCINFDNRCMNLKLSLNNTVYYDIEVSNSI